MGYGRGEYGQAGFGGSSFETGGPVLVSSDPLNGATGVSPTATVSFHLQSPAGLDEFSLDVNIDGLQAIVGGVFRPGYSGTIVQDPETDMVVTISGHPGIGGGATPVDISILDLAGNPATPSFSFTTSDLVTSAQSILITEALFIGSDHPIQVTETITISTVVLTGGFQAFVLDGSTLEVILGPTEVHFDQFFDLDRHRLRPLPEGHGVPAAILSVDPTFDVYQSGSSIFALPLEDAFVSGYSGGLGSLAEGVSNILDLNDTATIDPSSVGDFIEIVNGENVGRYQIIAVETSYLGPLPDRRPRIYVDRLLVLKDVNNGHVDGLATIVSSTATTVTCQMASHPMVTPMDGLQEVVFVFNEATGQSITLNEILSAYTPVTIDAYDTFTVTTNPSYFEGTVGDTLRVRGRIDPKVQWRHTSGIKSYTCKTTKFTLGESYFYSARLFSKDSHGAYNFEVYFTAEPPHGHENRPRLIQATFLPEDGTVLVLFDQPMRIDDANLGNIEDYTISGPTAVQVKKVLAVNPTTIALITSGLGSGDYILTVSTSTPKDIAGNPIDPLFNAVIFTAAEPETTRSIFTDKGPIAKPPLTLQTGTGASFQTYNEVTLPGSSLNASHIGLYVRLSGGILNGGTFRISSVLAATRARLANASFTLPDPNSGTLDWELFDPRHGQIADDPLDVVVRINGSPVVPEAVVGLLGQVVLDAAPIETDDVKVDYSWVCNPTVELRRLNSKEFRLNAWNRDAGYIHDKSQHKYRYNNVLIRPDDYDPVVPSAILDQPTLRELHYRAYERAYTPVLNDPSLLLLNSPIHRIAYPPSQRTLSEEFVAYEGIGLPESLTTDPWVRRGSGTAVSSSGHLIVTDASPGPYPAGQPIFWTRPIDLTFPHVFALSWRFMLDSTVPDGIFTGIAAGFSDEKVVLVVGYLDDGGTKKIGFLKRGYGDNPSSLAAWTGGIDLSDVPTGLPAEIDWDILHSYRVFQDMTGTIKVFIDGDIVELLRITPDELPYLEELQGPFDQIQGAFFGSLSRPAQNSSTWDFVRYLIQPTSPVQSSASSFASYEASVPPEQDAKPWTPVGFHGTETIQSSDLLLLDSTSATDATTASAVGLVGGDYKGFVRFEPLLTSVSEFVFDVQVQLLTFTHGVSQYGLTFAVDDGNRLMQVAFITDLIGPLGLIARFSYGGRSLPENFAPFYWQTVGTQTEEMVGRYLRITDSSLADGRVYFLDDTSPVNQLGRVVSYLYDYIFEFRCRVLSYTVDGVGFAGVFMQAYDSARTVGVLFEDIAGTRYVTFHSDGTTLGPLAQFAFDWGDGNFHTYRAVKSTTGDLISLFIDGTFIGSFPYSSFLAPAPDPIGQVSFGSSTPASSSAMSVVEWAYANAWRVRTGEYKRFVGLWKGVGGDSFLDYHLPLKTSGRNASAVGNALGDANASFLADGVVAGDYIVIDAGANAGVYPIASVGSPTALTLGSPWPEQPTTVDYRILKETDWSVMHKYRLHRTATGEVALLLDTDTTPLFEVGYNSLDLPESGVGIIRTLADGLPAFAFGSFDPENLEQSLWDFVRYGMTTSVTNLRIAPHHQVINQWNVMESPERLFTLLPHELTDYKSSSTGHVPKKDPDFLEDPGLTAFTLLNQSTPLYPRTQTFEVRAPYPVQEFIASLNQPQDVLNNDGNFTTNDGTVQYRLVVPDDVLYSSLDVIEQTTGTDELLAPFDDECQPNFGGVQYQKEVCLTYDGSVLPENDTTAPTPWQLVSDTPGSVMTSVSAGILTYSTFGSKTVYRNNTPLPDHPSLINEVRFKLKLTNDASGGTGPTQVMFGFSAPGMTAALTFVTTPLGERLVLILDLNNGNVLGSASFDFNDGNFHTYRIVRDPGLAVVQVFIDS